MSKCRNCGAAHRHDDYDSITYECGSEYIYAYQRFDESDLCTANQALKDAWSIINVYFMDACDRSDPSWERAVVWLHEYEYIRKLNNHEDNKQL